MDHMDGVNEVSVIFNTIRSFDTDMSENMDYNEFSRIAKPLVLSEFFTESPRTGGLLPINPEKTFDTSLGQDLVATMNDSQVEQRELYLELFTRILYFIDIDHPRTGGSFFLTHQNLSKVVPTRYRIQGSMLGLAISIYFIITSIAIVDSKIKNLKIPIPNHLLPVQSKLKSNIPNFDIINTNMNDIFFNDYQLYEEADGNMRSDIEGASTSEYNLMVPDHISDELVETTRVKYNVNSNVEHDVEGDTFTFNANDPESEKYLDLFSIIFFPNDSINTVYDRITDEKMYQEIISRELLRILSRSISESHVQKWGRFFKNTNWSDATSIIQNIVSLPYSDVGTVYKTIKNQDKNLEVIMTNFKKYLKEKVEKEFKGMKKATNTGIRSFVYLFLPSLYVLCTDGMGIRKKRLFKRQIQTRIPVKGSAKQSKTKKRTKDDNKVKTKSKIRGWPRSFFEASSTLLRRVALKRSKVSKAMKNPNPKIIVFDTETTGFSAKKSEIVQLSYILYDTETMTVLRATKLGDDIVKIDGDIPERVSKIHGIKKEDTLDKEPIKKHIDSFIECFNDADIFVAHNICFDIGHITEQVNKLITEYPNNMKYHDFLHKVAKVDNKMPETTYCTMKESRAIWDLKKNAKLMEIHKILFNQNVGGRLHNALVDISVTLRVYIKLTMNIDICENHAQSLSSINTVSNNNQICNLINPQHIETIDDTKPVKYDGPLISGVSKEEEVTSIFVKTDKKCLIVAICDENECQEKQTCSQKGGYKTKRKRRGRKLIN